MITQTQGKLLFHQKFGIVRLPHFRPAKLRVPTFRKDIKRKYIPHFSSTADNAST